MYVKAKDDTDKAHERQCGIALYGMTAWGRATYHVNGTEMVGRSVDERVPVDHASVELAQARPN